MQHRTGWTRMTAVLPRWPSSPSCRLRNCMSAELGTTDHDMTRHTMPCEQARCHVPSALFPRYSDRSRCMVRQPGRRTHPVRAFGAVTPTRMPANAPDCYRAPAAPLSPVTACPIRRREPRISDGSRASSSRRSRTWRRGVIGGLLRQCRSARSMRRMPLRSPHPHARRPQNAEQNPPEVGGQGARH